MSTKEWPESAADQSLRNAKDIYSETDCGCYYCCKRFKGAEVTGYTADDTAICPRCGIDAVVINKTDEQLREASERWF